jgi:hypothetical protein
MGGYVFTHRRFWRYSGACIGRAYKLLKEELQCILGMRCSVLENISLLHFHSSFSVAHNHAQLTCDFH